MALTRNIKPIRPRRRNLRLRDVTDLAGTRVEDVERFLSEVRRAVGQYDRIMYEIESRTLPGDPLRAVGKIMLIITLFNIIRANVRTAPITEDQIRDANQFIEDLGK